MNYSVVLVTYNRLKLLKECLKCLYNQSIPFYEIIVIDNCSTDGSDDYLLSEVNEHENLKVYRTTNNLGGAGGFAVGIDKVSNESDYTLIIDDDAMIASDYLVQITRQMNSDILAYSGVVKTDGKIDLSHRRRLSNSTLMHKTDVSLEEYEKDYFDYDFFTFCGIMISSNLIKKIGLPQKEYFIWYDDSEYSLRVRKYTIVRNINSAILNHKTVNLSSSNRLGWKSFYGYRNQWDMGIKYSRHPAIFNLYRNLFHIYRIIEFSFLSITDSSNKDYYHRMRRLHRDVISAAKKKTLGLNERYLPGSF